MENVIKFKVQVSDEKKYNSVNVRSDGGKIVGQIKNGAKVTLLGDCADKERTMIEGTQMNTRRKIQGTVLTRCPKEIK